MLFLKLPLYLRIQQKVLILVFSILSHKILERHILKGQNLVELIIFWFIKVTFKWNWLLLSAWQWCIHHYQYIGGGWSLPWSVLIHWHCCPLQLLHWSCKWKHREKDENYFNVMKVVFNSWTPLKVSQRTSQGPQTTNFENCW